MRIVSISILLTLPLAACASHPILAVDQSGTFPRPASFALVKTEPQISAVEAAVAQKLQAQGFTASENPRLLVQVGQSELPGRTGLYVARPTEEDWLTSPTRSKAKRTRRLVVSVTDVATGKEVYRAFGTERYRAGGSEEATLQEAVLGLLP